jgi:endonuclease VIII-like 1
MDYENFRRNIVDNLGGPAFKQKAVCEVLLNQKFFNGIGNYLRAEILFRYTASTKTEIFIYL